MHGREQIALVLDRQKSGRNARQSVAGGTDDDERDDRRDTGMTHHAANQTNIAALTGAIDAVEGAEHDIALFRRHRRAQPERTLGWLQRRRINGAEERGGRDHKRELRIHLPGQPRQEGGRNEHRHQDEGDADDRAEQLVHRLDRGVVARHAAFEVVGGALHHDDRIVDHDADCQHDRE